jgi:diadenosine tetraphosphate (Ap4A) HIT family hydrolase
VLATLQTAALFAMEGVARGLGIGHRNAAAIPPEGDEHKSPTAHGPLPGCLFCRMDDTTVHVILCENDSFFARFDNFPATSGHVEVVPKRHVVSFFDLMEQEVADAYSLLKEARRLLDERYGADGYTVGVNEGEAAGRTVHHLHIHLVPRRFGDVKDPRGGIRRALPNGDPDMWKASGPMATYTVTA